MPPGIRATVDVLEAHAVMWLEHRTADGSALARKALESVRALAEHAGGPSALDEDARRAYLDALELNLEAAIQRADLPEVVVLAEELAHIARDFDESSHGMSLIFAGIALRWQGRIVEAAGRFRQAWDEGRRRVLPAVAIEAGHWLAYTVLDIGDFVETEQAAREAHELRVRMGDLGRIRSRTRTVRHEVEFARGDERAALRALLTDVEREPDPHYRIAYHEAAAAWLAWLHGPTAADEVARHVETGRRLALEVGCPRCRLQLDGYSTEALFRVGRLAEATAAADELDLAPIPPDVQSRHVLRRVRALRTAAYAGPSAARPRDCRGVWRCSTGHQDRLGRRSACRWLRSVPTGRRPNWRVGGERAEGSAFPTVAGARATGRNDDARRGELGRQVRSGRRSGRRRRAARMAHAAHSSETAGRTRAHPHAPTTRPTRARRISRPRSNV